MPNIPEYSEVNEFFARELGLHGKKINHEEDEALPENCLIYCNDLTHWQRRLALSQKSSVSVIIGSNEYYDISGLLLINNFESIKCAFVQYLPNAKRIKVKSFASFILQFPRVLTQRAFYGTARLGFQKYGKYAQESFNVPIYPFPLGYTERFARELNDLGILQVSQDSLFQGKRFSDFTKRGKISFFGQKGSWYRRLMVKFFEAQPNFEMQTYSSFGGFTDSPRSTGYSELILKSRFVVCPPGNCSSQSFRYYEAIALGAIPVLAETSIQDWNTFDYWPSNKSWKNANFVDIWKSLSTLSQRELEELSLELRKFVLDQILTTRELLISCTNPDDQYSDWEPR
jgi:hypothetical protein